MIKFDQFSSESLRLHHTGNYYSRPWVAHLCFINASDWVLDRSVQTPRGPTPIRKQLRLELPLIFNGSRDSFSQSPRCLTPCSAGDRGGTSLIVVAVTTESDLLGISWGNMISALVELGSVANFIYLRWHFKNRVYYKH